jgi:hypothetical protein
LPNAGFAGLHTSCWVVAPLSASGARIKAARTSCAQGRPWRYRGRVHMALPVSTDLAFQGTSQKGIPCRIAPQTIDLARLLGRYPIQYREYPFGHLLKAPIYPYECHV